MAVTRFVAPGPLARAPWSPVAVAAGAFMLVERTDLRVAARGAIFEVSEAKRLRQLEDENAKLKKLLAEQMLDMAAMKELLSKKW